MSDQTNVFNENNQSTQTQEQPTASNVFNDQLKAIKNDSGEQKYQDVNTALDALKHSQELIPNLKSELDSYKAKVQEMEAKLAASASIEEQLSKLTAQEAPQQVPTETASITETDIEALLERKLAQRNADTIAATNVETVNTTLTQKYGEKAAEVVAEKAKELGMTLADMQSLASKNPKLILSQFNLSPTQTSTNVSTSSVNIKTDVTPDQQLQPPAKSLLRGATMREQAEYMRQIRENVYKKHGVTS